MPKGRAHKIIGTITGAAVAAGYSFCVSQEPERAWQYCIGGSMGGYMLSRMPDILEPAEKLGPNHRGFFHGIACNGTVAAISFKSVKNKLDMLVEKAKDFDSKGQFLKGFLCRCAVGAIIGGAGGYASHLLADFTTAKSLPLID